MNPSLPAAAERRQAVSSVAPMLKSIEALVSREAASAIPWLAHRPPEAGEHHRKRH
jgi:hypothetical protein